VSFETVAAYKRVYRLPGGVDDIYAGAHVRLFLVTAQQLCCGWHVLCSVDLAGDILRCCSTPVERRASVHLEVADSKQQLLQEG
jgi:hypothetical protein